MTTTAPADIGLIATDPDVFEVFYREHLLTVHRAVARRVADPHLAADLTAEVFLAAVDSAASYRSDRGAPAAWLVGVARHVVAAEFRRQGRDREVVRRVSGRRLLDADALTRIEERIDAEREARQLYAALAALPPRDRALMELVAVDGLSVTEAAAVLGVKPGTARVRLHRSRARLQSHLTPLVQEVIS
jgi:RNA polymerase sigma-70 factor (ECF subfamily)